VADPAQSTTAPSLIPRPKSLSLGIAKQAIVHIEPAYPELKPIQPVTDKRFYPRQHWLWLVQKNRLTSRFCVEYAPTRMGIRVLSSRVFLQSSFGWMGGNFTAVTAE
jgi:hypothetical protein